MAVHGVGRSGSTPVPININSTRGKTNASAVKPRANLQPQFVKPRQTVTQQPDANEVKIGKTPVARQQGVGTRLDIKA